MGWIQLIFLLGMFAPPSPPPTHTLYFGLLILRFSWLRGMEHCSFRLIILNPFWAAYFIDLANISTNIIINKVAPQLTVKEMKPIYILWKFLLREIQNSLSKSDNQLIMLYCYIHGDFRIPIFIAQTTNMVCQKIPVHISRTTSQWIEQAQSHFVPNSSSDQQYVELWHTELIWCVYCCCCL